MNSCLYRANVMHHRFEPKQHRFHYNVFMFYIDLNEIDLLSKKFFLISRNRFNIFNFRDKDHLQLPRENPDKTKSVKEHIKDYLKQNGVELKNEKIFLLTNLCTFGYQFNPVSFYFTLPSPALGEGLGLPAGQAGVRSCVVEIGNTYLEMKPFFLGKENFDGKKFHLNTTKYFYVSPFTDMDTNFDFNIEVPDEKMNIKIDDYKKGRRFFISSLTGERKEMTNARLFWYAIRFPFITLQIISLIHWNAFKLWLKKIPYHKKNSNIDLQREVYRPYKNS